MRDLGIADRLRAAGLRVIEVAGWQTAGSDSFDPGGVGQPPHRRALVRGDAVPRSPASRGAPTSPARSATCTSPANPARTSPT